MGHELKILPKKGTFKSLLNSISILLVKTLRGSDTQKALCPSVQNWVFQVGGRVVKKHSSTSGADQYERDQRSKFLIYPWGYGILKPVRHSAHGGRILRARLTQGLIIGCVNKDEWPAIFLQICFPLRQAASNCSLQWSPLSLTTVTFVLLPIGLQMAIHARWWGYIFIWHETLYTVLVS